MNIDHIGIVCNNIEEYIKRHLFLWNECTIGDVITNEKQRIKECFILCENGTNLEIIEPYGDNSPVSKFLIKGEGIHHICYLVKDIETAIKNAKENGGLVVCKPIKDIAFEDRRIAFVIIHGSLIEFVEK